MTSDIFLRTFIDLSQICSYEKKYLMANHGTFMTKEVRKVIIITSKLRNKFQKDNNEEPRNDYRKQPNLFVALARKAIQQYFHLIF